MSFLGMGVDAIAVNLFRSEHEEEINSCMKNIQLSEIIIGNYQPRKTGKITNESIQDLVSSIQEKGVLQPIIVRRISENQYELIAGERRYRSAHAAQLSEIPCVIKDVNEKDAFAIALIENIQREQLSLLDESESLLKLKNEHFLSVDEVSKMIGKPRTTVANLIRVASMLSEEGKLLWDKGVVDYGHIRAVIVLDHEFQDLVLQHVIDKQLSVRKTEQLIKERKYIGLSQKYVCKVPSKSPVLNDEQQNMLKKILAIHGESARIKSTKSGKILFSIEFENFEETYCYFKEKYSIDFSD